MAAKLSALPHGSPMVWLGYENTLQTWPTDSIQSTCTTHLILSEHAHSITNNTVMSDTVSNMDTAFIMVMIMVKLFAVTEEAPL